MHRLQTKKPLQILALGGFLFLTQCGVRRDPIPQHSQEGPHSASTEDRKSQDGGK